MTELILSMGGHMPLMADPFNGERVDALKETLASLVDAVAGEQHDPEELRKALGPLAPAAIEKARRLLKEL